MYYKKHLMKNMQIYWTYEYWREFFYRRNWSYKSYV